MAKSLSAAPAPGDDPSTPVNSAPGAARGSLRPLLKWAGGKRKIAPQIVDLFPKEFGAYHEPFAGGLAVFCEAFNRYRLADRPCHLSDINIPLMQLYSTLATDAWSRLAVVESDLACEYLDLPYGEPRYRWYTKLRAEFNAFLAAPHGRSHHEHLRHCASLIVLNKTCFNGLWRTNRKGAFNVPHGEMLQPAFPRLDDFAAWHAALGDVFFGFADFDASLATVTAGDVVYLDPPYDEGFTSYAPGAFTWADQERLAARAQMLVNKGATVIASNRATERICTLWLSRGFTYQEISVQHSVGAKGDRRRKVPEIIAVGRPS